MYTISCIVKKQLLHNLFTLNKHFNQIWQFKITLTLILEILEIYLAQNSPDDSKLTSSPHKITYIQSVS